MSRHRGHHRVFLMINLRVFVLDGFFLSVGKIFYFRMLPSFFDSASDVVIF